jgi:hypothetical protein
MLWVTMWSKQKARIEIVKSYTLEDFDITDKVEKGYEILSVIDLEKLVKYGARFV